MTPCEINETADVAAAAAPKVNFHTTQGSKTTDALLATTQSVADSAIQHDSGKHFCYFVRIEGKDKVKRIMIPSIEIGTYDDLVDVIRERYLSDDGELNWSMDIETTADLLNAFKYNSPNAKMKKMLALVSNPQDPLADDLDHDFLPSFLCTNDRNSFASASPAEGSRTGEKRKIVAAAPVKKSPKKPRSKSKSSSEGRKLPVRTKIIQALAELHSLGSVKPPRVEVAMFAGYSNDKSKGFTNPLSALSGEGMVMYPDSKSVALTAKGLASEEAQGITPPHHNNEVHSRIKALLKSKQIDIFEKLSDGNVQERDQLAASVGYSNSASKGFSNAIGKMSTLGIVHYPRDSANAKRKLVQLTDMCFPFSKVAASNTATNEGHLTSTPPMTSFGEENARAFI